MKKLIKEHIEKFFDNKHLLLSIDTSFLIMGSLMIFIGCYAPIYGDKQNDVRGNIGTICIAIWFFFFPALTRERKDKILSKLAIHFTMALINLIILSFAVRYLLNNMNSGTIFKDIAFCIGGVIVCAYLVYILVEFFSTFFEYIRKFTNIILPTIEEKQNGLKTVMEGITSIVLTLTAFFAAMIGFYNGVIMFIKLLD